MEAVRRDVPKGPSGQAAAHVFAFSDQENPMLCHLARSVEAAGGWLQVLGLRDGKLKQLPWGDVDAMGGGSATRADEPWHFEDKSIMLKKHHFLARALREMPPNATVVFVDAFDVLFQRPLDELVEAYKRVAGPAVAASGGAVAGGLRRGGELLALPAQRRGACAPPETE
eukprot:CAMPEP_0177393330 /NCGR_PEP_ID=MMETSP0368-20130122/54892_1 /TAXON_ID=447022 ORGANISM="Scrippsiella hangoei-like, Strain SHHI-4" /NCGR_SAMPLE_ID=MMETSP0368 /ASSEMBLY_ACC=CAM_ASM_000363 /LENGTH=169 /DNA_ID=CAMNT_0018859503 /DNA_START=30 /DNA_END=535 /DNA_ORIENTATION=-